MGKHRRTVITRETEEMNTILQEMYFVQFPNSVVMHIASKPRFINHLNTFHHISGGKCVSVRPSRWAVVHRERLLAHGSCLEFKLRQLKFLSLLSGGHTSEALAYAKILGQFAPKHIFGQSFLHSTCLTSISPPVLIIKRSSH